MPLMVPAEMTRAFALVGADRRIVRSTEAFDRSYESAAAAFEHSPELARVLAGEADSETLWLGDLSLEIEAVTDGSGARHAILSDRSEASSVPATDPSGSSELPAPQLREALDGSTSIAWVKDLDGRFVYVNRRYREELGVSEDRVRGRKDEELAPQEAVDGPRLNGDYGSAQESLELEYTIPAFQGRPPLAAVRFVIRDRDGDPAGVCGVAARLEDAALVRGEAARLTGIARAGHVDPAAMRAQLLEEWGISHGPGGFSAGNPVRIVPAEPTRPSEPAEMSELETPAFSAPEPVAFQAPEPIDDSVERSEPREPAEQLPSSNWDELAARWEKYIHKLEAQAQRWREELDLARDTVTEREELESALAAERARADDLARALGQVRARIADVDRAAREALPDHGDPAGNEESNAGLEQSNRGF